MNRESFFGKPILRYTRADALRDGVLHDISTIARACAGLRLPVAVSQGLWRALAGRVPFNARDERLRDLCYGFAFGMVGLTRGRWQETVAGREFAFTFRTGERRLPARLVLAPGDDGEPVATFLLPKKD